ncbi:AAA family ATPase [Streptomyces sp. NPDC090112]|uniref:AAA family ATPase n=1 Tax=Streptomyces sp. NPDC090112 TaxID=3365949 RepID=UPI0038136E78
MRLHSANFANFRRFSGESSLIIDDPLVALVGPNEAGKTSILQAIEKCAKRVYFEESDVARGVEHESLTEPLVRLKFILEEEDLAAISGIPHCDTPKWLTLNGHVGKRNMALTPMPSRDTSQTDRISELIDATLKTGRVSQSGKVERIAESDVFSDVLLAAKRDLPSFSAYRTKPVPDSRMTNIDSALRHLGVLVHGDPDSFLEVDGEPNEHAGMGIASGKSLSRIERKGYDLSVMERIASELVSLRKALTGPAPANAIAAIILGRIPSVVTFTEKDRDLPGSIELSSGEDFPQGLLNLLRVAKVDSEELRKTIDEDAHLKLAEMLEQANIVLKEVFQAWRQESVWPVIQIFNKTLKVLVRVASTSAYTDLQDRSDGLRQFIALVSCVNASRFFEKGERDVIVVIDEAENHLHYDAQADLVEVFTRQDVAKQIIYSTHSAGCLPEDLGSGVRVVRQVPETATSSITNWFWSDGSGFTPLLLAMGAATLAFASVRKVIITEGPSDMLLLPSLLREATGLASLGYQIAPGLSELSPELVADIDLEAARSGFLVDGDPGGHSLLQKLIDNGCAQERVLILGGAKSGITLEDLVDGPIYRACVNELLDGGSGNHMPEDHPLPQGNSHAGVKAWCEKRGISVPGKRLVAQSLVRRSRSEKIVSANHVQTLRDLHSAATALLS